MHSSGVRRLVATVVSGLAIAVGAASPAWSWTTAYGHVRAADRTLLSGCHHYPYRYVLKPPTSDWIFETWLYDPRGKPRASGDFEPGSDPTRGRGTFGVCRQSVVPGRFTIRSRLTWYTPGMLPTDPPVQHSRWFEPAHFRLHR